MKLLLEKSALRAALKCAAKSDIRYYLNGILVEVRPGFDHAIVAGCDGHTLFVCRIRISERGGESVTQPMQVIIPRETVEKECGARHDPLDMIEFGEVSEQEWRLGDAIFKPVAGKFPDFEKVIPANVSGETAKLNPELVSRVYCAMGQFTGSKHPEYATLHHNGEGPAVLTYGASPAIGVVMPMRDDEKDTFAGFDCWPKPKQAAQPNEVTDGREAQE